MVRSLYTSAYMGKDIYNIYEIQFSWIFEHVPMVRIIQKFDFFASFLSKGCLPKKNCWEGDIGPYGREGGKKNPLFLAHQKGDIFLWGEGSKTFCHMSHVQFCVSVSSQFVAVFDALHYENFIYHIIKKLTWTFWQFFNGESKINIIVLTVYWFIF